MATKRTCSHCKETFTIVRNPNQEFCSNRSCQNARKNKWRNKKRKNDADYRANQNEASKRWRKKNPLHLKNYRKTHPAYVEQNRRKQRLRNQRLKIVNSDALSAQPPIRTGIYQMTPYHKDVANSDAFLVELSVITGGLKQIA